MSATTFHLDRPPQEWLDQLHEIDIPELYDPGHSKTQRLNLIEYKGKKLRYWYEGVDALVDKIGDRYDSDHQAEMELAQAPYKLLRQLGKQLLTAVNDLEQRTKKDKVVPEGFMFGDYIFGDEDSGDWHLGSGRDADRYDNMLAVKRRLAQLMQEYKPMVQEMKVTRARAGELKSKVSEWMSEYQSKKTTGYIATRLVGLLVLTAAALGSGFFLVTERLVLGDAANAETLGGALLVLGVAGAIGMIVIYRRRQQRLNELQQDIREGRQRLQQFSQQMQKQRRDFYPTNQLVQELRGEYKELKASF